MPGFLTAGRHVLAWLLCLAPSIGSAQTVPTVAAASDLRFALEEIIREYGRATGGTVRVTYGSSGSLAQQIEQGAPFDVFMAADEAYVTRLADRKLVVGESALYAIGRIVLFVGKGSPVRADERLTDVARALKDGRLRKFAIANPDHAPYGRAAREALEALGLWAAMRDHLVLGENVSQAAQFAASGSAQGGIIALSLAVSPNFGAVGDYVVLPTGLHRPLRQRMALLRRGADLARPFYDFLQGASARAVFRRYGFLLPGE